LVAPGEKEKIHEKAQAVPRLQRLQGIEEKGEKNPKTNEKRRRRSGGFRLEKKKILKILKEIMSVG